MAAYCGSIGSVNVLDFVSTDLFDESQENPFLLQQKVPVEPAITATPRSPHKASVRFAELPLSDNDGAVSARSHTSPPPSPIKQVIYAAQSSPNRRPQSFAPGSPITPGGFHAPMMSTPSPMPAQAPIDDSPVNRPSITISLPYSLFNRQGSSDSNASTATSMTDAEPISEETELHKLLYSLSRLGLAQGAQLDPSPPQLPNYLHVNVTDQQYSPSHSYTLGSTFSAPASPASQYSSSSLWLPQPPPPTPTTVDPSASRSAPGSGTASLMFRSMPNRESQRMGKRRSTKKRFSSAPCSPVRSGDENAEDDGGYGSQPSSPQHSRGSVTFVTVKNLLRGGGALARTVRREQTIRRPTCMGTELTISSQLKRRQKFQRPTVITDAYHRVSAMKLGTSPMKPKIKHIAFPQVWNGEADNLDHEVDPGMPSPKGKLRRDSLITLETLDKIGTRHACPVHLIEEALPDFTEIAPRVDTWNDYKKPKKNLRRPSTWLLGATATSTPRELNP